MNQIQKNNLIRFGGLLVAIFILNLASSKIFFRIDLTQEKLYTLSGETRHVLSNLDDIVYVKVYLDGELTIPFKKFQRNIMEMLEEFRVYGKGNFNYEFINLFEDLDAKAKNKLLTDYARRGLMPKNIVHQSADGTKTEKYIIPGAMVVHGDIEMPINLLEDNPAKSGEENINNSIVNLEYKLISTIRNLAQKEERKIVMLEGHGELPDEQVGDIMNEMSKSFTVDRGAIDGRTGILDAYEAVIIAAPRKSFNEKDKFCIDQYIMQGGKVIFLLDGAVINFDSLADGAALAYPNQLNLDDMLFRYGVRMNYDLVQDLQCNFIPINMALTGSAANFQPVPWPYTPIISMGSESPITKNLNMVWLRFTGSLDTIGNRHKTQITPLLVSSPATRVKAVPAVVNLAEWREADNVQKFKSGRFINGVLIEGEFNSVFKNRIVADFLKGSSQQFKGVSQPTKIAIIADGDIIRNDVSYTPQGVRISPLGYDKYTRQTFGNKEFLANLVHYMTDDANLLQLKNKNIKIRLLDRSKILEERLKWQLINLALPVILIVIAGAFISIMRKRKFAV